MSEAITFAAEFALCWAALEVAYAAAYLIAWCWLRAAALS
jgi:hypothetical protein